MRNVRSHHRVIRLGGAVIFSLMYIAVTGNTVAAFGPVNLPRNPSPPIIYKKKTPLDQPLEEILPVNVNTTDAATLMKIPGINRTAARQIVNHRDRNGKYTSLDQLKGFSGIGASTIYQLKKYLTVK